MQKLQINAEDRFSRLQNKKLPDSPEEAVEFALFGVHMSRVHCHRLIYFNNNILCKEIKYNLNKIDREQQQGQTIPQEPPQFGSLIIAVQVC